MAQVLADLDPTGTLSAAGAAVSLVGKVLRAVPAAKNAANAVKAHSGTTQGSESLQRAQTSTEVPVIGVDSEREKRAYETVNFVLRELGSRVCAAGLVDEHALEKALTGATQHIEVNLFSGEANRLFASLAPKLADPILVNAVFTSIYFIGALTAELRRSLPNYKESYTPLGPWIVQQLFRTAIGEDAFGDNLTANLDAYKTLATTAGLLRPTDIGYSAFPGFPALSPSRYSSRSFGDVRNHKSIYEKLVKHFDKFGFPQPIGLRQADVGLIRDWRFLAGDSPSRHYDVEKADKYIGETFGRVLHWLICSADRMPPGQAVVAYYAQHIELIKWIGQRMGYSILSGGTDLDLSGAHSKLDKHCRAIIGTWMILMPSERAQATRRASSANWAQTHMAVAAHAPQIQASQPQLHQEKLSFEQAQRNAGSAPIVVPVIQPQAQPFHVPHAHISQTRDLGPQNLQNSAPPPQASQAPFQTASVPQFALNAPAPITTSPQPKSIDDILNDVARDFNNILIPQCEKYLSSPPADPSNRLFEYKRLTQHIEKGVIGWLDGFPIPEGHPARTRRKAMIVEAQQLLQSLDVANRPPSASSTPSIASTPSFASHPPSAVFVSKVTNASNNVAPAASNPPTPTPTASDPSPGISPSQQSHPMSPTSPPPYSPNTPPSAVTAGINTNPADYPFPAKKPIRRKAPPPPKKFIAAKAIYDFEPEEEDDEELAFKEGDDIEIIEKTAALEEEGWCRARVKGSKKLGLVPLEYLEIEEKPPTLKPTPVPSRPPMASAASTAQPPQHELYGSESQITYGTTSADHHCDTASISSTMYAPSSHPSYQSGYPTSSYQSAYPNNPQIYMADHQASHHTSKMGKKMEVAGLAVATAGAAAGIASYVKQAQPSDAQPAGDAAQQQQATTENVTVNESYDPTSNVQNNNDSTDVTQNNYDPTTITAPPLDPNSSPPAIADLSAYASSPFDPGPPLNEPNPVAGLAAVDPYFAAQSPDLAAAPDFDSALLATGVPQDPTVYQDVPTAVSPFAGIATTGPVDLVQQVPVTDTMPLATDGVEYTGWETSELIDDADSDVGF